MENREKLEEIIKEEIYKLRNLGEHERKGSDHLYNRSLSKFKIGKLKKGKDQGKLIYEVICKYDVYTETEFLHTPEMDELYTEHYKDKFILDNDFRLLEIKDIRKNK
ncbi:MAG: hypothetical protein ACFE78_04595 [Candidatus Hodarchaeota archaeon]